MNPARLCHLFSSDVFDRVDDPKNHLKKCITPEIMQRFLKAGVPPHDLVLKVNDICIVLRNLSKRNGLSNNVSLLNFFTVKHALHSTHSKVRVWIGQRMYAVQRSYASFCELDARLRRKYPRSTIPPIPLAGSYLNELQMFLFAAMPN